MEALGAMIPTPCAGGSNIYGNLPTRGTHRAPFLPVPGRGDACGVQTGCLGCVPATPGLSAC